MSNHIRIIAALIITTVIVITVASACATPTPQTVYIEERPTEAPAPDNSAAKVTIYEDYMRDNVCYILYNSHALGAPVAISCVKY